MLISLEKKKKKEEKFNQFNLCGKLIKVKFNF